MTEKTRLSSEMIVCKPTKWFLWRALAMLLMFSVFTGLFLKDGLTGYRDKNLQYYTHQSFVATGESYDEYASGGTPTEGGWKLLSAEEKIGFPEEGAEILPKGTDLEMVVPEILVNGFTEFKAEGGEQGAVKLWREYTREKDWNSEPVEAVYNADKIRNQFIAAAVAGALALAVLFIALRILSRSIKADDNALYPQEGGEVLYSDMIRIDKRKWATKGMALVYYTRGDQEKKTKIDGMVYGQFNKEDDEPAEKLFAKVLANFKGEILDYEADA